MVKKFRLLGYEYISTKEEAGTRRAARPEIILNIKADDEDYPRNVNVYDGIRHSVDRVTEKNVEEVLRKAYQYRYHPRNLWTEMLIFCKPSSFVLFWPDYRAFLLIFETFSDIIFRLINPWESYTR